MRSSHAGAAKRLALLAAVLAGLVLVTGCGSSGRQFPPLQPIQGAIPLLGPVTGTGSRTFVVRPGRDRVAYTLACLKGRLVWLRAADAAFAVHCGADGYGGEIASARKHGPARPLTIRVQAPAREAWRLRVQKVSPAARPAR